MKLIVEGILGSDSMRKIDLILNKDVVNTSVFVFTSYTNNDIPLNHEFTTLYAVDDIKVKFKGLFKVVAITDQLCKPLDLLPIGFKGICQINCVGNNMLDSKLKKIIPTVENWYEYKKRFIFK